MTARHLATVDDVLCATPRRWPALTTTNLGDVTCSRCTTRLRLVTEVESAAADERRIEARMYAACQSVGIAHLWDKTDTGTATGRMIRGLLGAVATYFDERDGGAA